MSWGWQQTTVSLKHPPLFSAKGRAHSYVPLLSTQDFEKESWSSPAAFVRLRYLWAGVPQGSNKTRRKIALVTMQPSSTSINQLLAHHHSYILPHQSAVLIPGSLHSPRHTLHPRKTLPQDTCPAINPLSWESWLNHLCDLDSLTNLCRKLGQLKKTCMILVNRKTAPLNTDIKAWRRIVPVRLEKVAILSIASS